MKPTSPFITHRTIVTVAASSILIALFAALAFPDFVRARTPRSENGCVNNLKLIEGAKEKWAAENGKTMGQIVTWENIRPYLKLETNETLPTCPHGGTYTIGKVAEPPKCSCPGDQLN